jgi:hypothetical protein
MYKSTSTSSAMSSLSLMSSLVLVVCVCLVLLVFAIHNGNTNFLHSSNFGGHLKADLQQSPIPATVNLIEQVSRSIDEATQSGIVDSIVEQYTHGLGVSRHLLVPVSVQNLSYANTSHNEVIAANSVVISDLAQRDSSPNPVIGVLDTDCHCSPTHSPTTQAGSKRVVYSNHII